jgi:hypothetical protein
MHLIEFNKRHYTNRANLSLPSSSIGGGVISTITMELEQSCIVVTVKIRLHHKYQDRRLPFDDCI